jgi:hypothetical protein
MNSAMQDAYKECTQLPEDVIRKSEATTPNWVYSVLNLRRSPLETKINPYPKTSPTPSTARNNLISHRLYLA